MPHGINARMCGFVVVHGANDVGDSGEAKSQSTRLASGTQDDIPALAVNALGLTGISWDVELDLDATSDPVLVVDKRGIITATNRNVEAVLGYVDDELIGTAIESLLATDQRGTITTDVPPRGMRFVSVDRGVHALHRNGDRIACELVLHAGEDGSLVIIVRALAYERASLREEDMAEIVHDLKSPLSTIALEAHLLGDRLASPHQVDRIERNVAYMDRLVHELLDLCSLDAGHFSIERRPTELRELLERVLDRVLSVADRGRVSLDAKTNVIVACDDGRIERVIANFVENALKYAPAGSSIVVQLSVTATAACVSVIDSGPGIPDKELSTLFDKYRRASTARGQNGSGLGLYVSRKIIEAHGGRVGVESRRAIGSRFFFELPVSARAGAAVEAARTLEPQGAYVLVVDDDVDQAIALSEILRHGGYETALAASASEAENSVRMRRPHLLIVDARLRGTDGIELLYRLHVEHAPIPSLILSGMSPEEPRIAAAIRALGCGYVEKPVDVPRLLRVMGELRGAR